MTDGVCPEEGTVQCSAPRPHPSVWGAHLAPLSRPLCQRCSLQTPSAPAPAPAPPTPVPDTVPAPPDPP